MSYGTEMETELLRLRDLVHSLSKRVSALEDAKPSVDLRHSELESRFDALERSDLVVRKHSGGISAHEDKRLAELTSALRESCPRVTPEDKAMWSSCSQEPGYALLPNQANECTYSVALCPLCHCSTLHRKIHANADDGFRCVKCLDVRTT